MPMLVVLVINIFVTIQCFNAPHVTSGATPDAIKQGESMSFSETLVSANGVFELGFFTPGQSNKNIYLGIWYKMTTIGNRNRTVVWVANREYPIRGTYSSSCVFSIDRAGNLVVSDGRGMTYVFTSQSGSANTSATLLDSGNLVLRDINSSRELWQSFDYPSDHFLPGMKLGFNSRTGKNWSLTSWSGAADPTPGDFSTLLDSSLEFFVMKGSQKYWTSGRWNGNIFSEVPEMRQNYIFNFSYISDENGTYFTYSLYNKSIFSRLAMDVSGQIQQLSWLETSNEWVLFWAQPRDQCDVYARCGAFSTCTDPLASGCQCLQGFEPSSVADWRRDEWSRGCVRRTPLQCEKKDGFLLVKQLTFPTGSDVLEGRDAQGCNLACFNNCSCNAYAYTDDRKCLIWKGDLLGAKELYGGNDLFLKLATSDLQNINGGRKRRSLIISLPVILIMLILSFIAFLLWRRRVRQRGKEEMGQDLLSYDFNASTHALNTDSSKANNSLSGGRWDVELPLFNLESISISTNDFDDSNKLGQGGFGPVYKGKLLNGQEVAIKRLSRGSGQGMEELKNEVTLIAKLQHRNLVRLLGCCIEGEEKILIYEYMPNKSLDFFLFDRTNRTVLDWAKRVRIVEGIAQGLLYLHEHSRLRIIHRDLKASNVLLDNQMNAKISDFGMARIFGGNESQANTNRIVGTYGYMPPEYVMEGLFSIKSDVFSFGILLLEILSGKKNADFRLSDSLNLSDHAWKLWKSERALELIDPALGDSFYISKALRCINVGLLCVQEQAVDRPTMADVLIMLSNDATPLPFPKQPAFCPRSYSEDSSRSNPTNLSVNNVTISLVEGR
ncbi:hypothetical protein Syun_023028 [Stephania yunnanensis]|uniref:Receptor-like serine/threonine-protein kinase n=1 Tax=Stephania yunnanensis TaxID=152371 RepID=A0AAP0FAY9_9MAGN